MVSITPKTRTLQNGTPNDAQPVEANFIDLYNNDASLALAINAVEQAYANKSQANTFTALQTFQGGVQGVFPTGLTMAYIAPIAPIGWLMCDGRTIGNGTSAATSLASDDTQALFILLWTHFADAQAPVSGGRGVSALADFNGSKTIALPDLRGRVLIGVDGIANRITSASLNGANADTLGGAGGAETHTLLLSEIPAHTHANGSNGNIARPQTGTGALYAALDGGVSGGTTQTGAAGEGGSHSNTQPWLALHYVIKL